VTARYCFIGACPSLTGPFVNYVRDHGEEFGHVKEITYRTFAKHMEPDFLREWKEAYGFSLRQDWGVTYYKSRTPSGIPALFFVWSAMEHVFLPCGTTRFDLDEETRLAEEAEKAAHLTAQATRLAALKLDLPLNRDGSVALYHGTTPEAAADVVAGRRLLSPAPEDPFVYLTTSPEAAARYGPVVLAVDIFPTQLEDDPSFALRRGVRDYLTTDRRDFRIPTGYGGVAYIIRARPHR
jgi:hypothetical protein